MINIKNKESDDQTNWMHYLIFFIVIFVSDDTFNFGTNENLVYIAVKYLIYLLLTVYLLTISNLKFLTILTKSSLVFYFIVFSVFITVFLNYDFSGGYVYQIWLFFLALIIVNFYSYKNFIDVYLKLIYILSLISLIIFVIASISLSFFEIFPVQYNSAGATMYNLGVAIVFADGSYVRNTSIFREPGVFMIYLNIAILFELFFKSEINKKYLFVFILALFSTFSTAAFITVGIIFISFLFTNNKSKASIKNKSLIVGLLSIGFIVVLLSGELYSMIFEKMGKDNIGDGSSLARAMSVLANFNIFLDNIFFGVGIKNYPLFFEKYTRALIGFGLDVGNNTNTITTILAVYGFLFGFLFIYMLISFAKKTSNSIIVRTFIFLVLIMLYSNEELRYSLMSATFLMWGLLSRKKVEN
ncbi:hypothetical protein [Flavobacterium sp. MMS24-S5]|uniref:hypothetical protein n=1 Tax=Flavobacterium sp. MMS24-S5 TaxID=3416605 RepID=UPI003D05A27B